MGLKHRHNLASTADDLLSAECNENALRTNGKINIAVCFPAPYKLAISNLGFLTVHRLASLTSQIGVERFFLGYERIQDIKPPYYSFETRRPLGDFDILAFSFSFEGDFDRIPLIFGPLGFPIDSENRRNKRFPLLVAGGAAIASNPSALSRIFDVLVPGEAENTLIPMLERFLENGISADSVADLPGVWAPKIKERIYSQALRHNVAEEPAYSHITSPNGIFGNARLFEIMRGCPRACSFCLARVIYNPPRPVPTSRLVKWLDERAQCQELALVAPSLFDHPQIEEILKLLAERNVRLHNSSVKWEKLSEPILRHLYACGIRGLTLAPETGSARLRKAMNKALREDEFNDTLERISKHEFEQLKLYFMAGLPTEETIDLDDSIRFLSNISERFSNKFKNLTASFSAFIPKQGTPWEKANACTCEELKKKFNYIKTALRRFSNTLKLQFESPSEASRQAYLAKVGPKLADEYEKSVQKWMKDQ